MSNSEPELIEWYLQDLFRKRRDVGARRFALLVLNQPVERLGVVRRVWDNAHLRVAADGGANRLYDASREAGDESIFGNLTTIIGDLDSLRPDVSSFFISSVPPTTIILNPDQNSTDFGKAVNHIRSSSPGADIIALGGLGGRVDQALGQLHNLLLFQLGQGNAAYQNGRVYLLGAESVTFVLAGGVTHLIILGEGIFGKHVGILPLGKKSVLTTRGLEWDVQGWETEFGGRVSTSNHVFGASGRVEVETSESVLFTIALNEELGAGGKGDGCWSESF